MPCSEFGGTGDPETLATAQHLNPISKAGHTSTRIKSLKKRVRVDDQAKPIMLTEGHPVFRAAEKSLLVNVKGNVSSMRTCSKHISGWPKPWDAEIVLFRRTGLMRSAGLTFFHPIIAAKWLHQGLREEKPIVQKASNKAGSHGAEPV